MLDFLLRIIFQDSEYYLAYTSRIFRPKYSPIKKHCKNLITNPSKTYRTHFALQVILRKWLDNITVVNIDGVNSMLCHNKSISFSPFLILSHSDETHTENLIKMLSGKNIDQVGLVFKFNLKCI